MGDMGDLYNAIRDERRERRAKFGIECPQCRIVRPKAHPSILLPNQRCKVDGYRDPRPDDRFTDEAVGLLTLIRDDGPSWQSDHAAELIAKHGSQS